MKPASRVSRAWLGALVVGLAALLQGCAHPITLNGDLSKVTAGGAAKVDHKVGLYIGDDDRKREVITPGGGGDKVSYYPYRDLESGIYKAMSEVFVGVSKVSGPADPKVQAEGLDYVMSPVISTTSSSSSVLTWPPTQFSIEVTCKVTDASGKAVTQVSASGQGQAEFSEFKSDFSLAAKRATEDVLAKLVRALREKLGAAP